MPPDGRSSRISFFNKSFILLPEREAKLW